MCLSAALKRAGHEVRLCSPRIRDVEKILKIFPARVVAYSVTTGYHNFYLKFNDLLKKRNSDIFSIFGGPHVTFAPDFIEGSGSIDAVCRGEGDLALVEFVKRLECGGAYHLTLNFYVRRGGNIYRNALRDLVDDLDGLPFPDRALVYGPYRPARENKIKNFMTMRGCLNHCSYCFNDGYNKLYNGKGRICRRRGVDNVIDEILDVAAEYPLELVYFRDDNFLLFPDWVEEFCRQYRRRIGLPFVCAGRLDMVTERGAAELKKADCVSIEAGIEAGNDYIRNEVLKRVMSRAQITNGARILHSHGIKILAENLIGVPGSTIENELETYSLNKECSVYYCNSSILQPYFGTEIYDRLKDPGLFNTSIQNIGPEDYLKGRLLLKLKDGKRRERLNKIIAVSGKLKLPDWLVRLLISLPLKRVYDIIHVVFKGYCGSRLYPFKKNFKERICIFFQLFTQHHLFTIRDLTK